MSDHDKQYEAMGYALATRVLQSDLYAKLDDRERAECDALVRGAHPSATETIVVYGGPKSAAASPARDLFRYGVLFRSKTSGGGLYTDADAAGEVSEVRVNGVTFVPRDSSAVTETDASVSPKEWLHLIEVAREQGRLSGKAEAQRAEADADQAKNAALWRDLVLLHPMDLMMLFNGSPSNGILLEKLAFFIESKRAAKRKTDGTSER